MDATHEHFGKDGFRLRGTAMSRIDAFSDVVFGFALTLLVVSLEVPKTFAELHTSLRGFLPFAICFFFLMMVWHAHYEYFRRFGTHDMRTIVINAMLLFVVLFYVYPLKFLFTIVSYGLLGFSTDALESMKQLSSLMVLYGVGFAAIYALLAGLYWNGWSQRVELGLTPVEVVLAKSYVWRMGGTAAVGVLACVLAVAVPAKYSGFTGWAYVLISGVHSVVGRVFAKKLEKARGLLAG